MSMLTNLDLIRRVPLFSMLTAAQAESLVGAVGKRRYKRGECIVEQGKKTDTLYIILDGRLRAIAGPDALVLDTPVATRGEGMRVRYRYIGFNEGSQALRYLTGPIAGGSRVVLEVDFIGANGEVLRFGNGSWSRQTVPTTESLSGVSGITSSNVVAVQDARISNWCARGGPEMSPYRTEVVAVTVPPSAVT